MAKPRQSKRIHTTRVKQGTGQEAPVVGAQPTKRVTAKDIELFEKDFVQVIEPEIELTREAPGGVDSFQELHRLKMDRTEKQYYSIDTTMMIQRVLGDRGFHYLCIIGPRRFGKTLNMSMFESFMDGYCSGDQGNIGRNKKVFNGLNITKNDPLLCSIYQQKFFIIKLSFSTLGCASDIKLVKKKLADAMLLVFQEFLDLCGDNRIFQEAFEVLLKFNSDISDHGGTLEDSLKTLVSCIKRSSAKANNTPTAEKLPQQVALFIDEFDKPYVAALNKGADFYNKVRTLMDGFLSGVKEKVFDRVFFTGVQPVPFQNASQSLNNVSVFSIFDPFFCPYYGFTDNDMDQILTETGLMKYKEGFRVRYNGYGLKVKRMASPSSYPFTIPIPSWNPSNVAYLCGTGASVVPAPKAFLMALKPMRPEQSSVGSFSNWL